LASFALECLVHEATKHPISRATLRIGNRLPIWTCQDLFGHHALKRAISFHRRGEIRDRSAEGQHDRIAGMNLLAAIIIFWNTKKLGDIAANWNREGKTLSPDLLAHVSPLGWEHINLTGEYRWTTP
jgi:hypothetical protein